METLKIDVNEAFDATMKIAKSKPNNGPDQFSKYAPIYMAPTGNVKDTINLYKNSMSNIDSALVVGSQGSFSYELALNGVKKIDCFDKNILQYLFFSLYNTALKKCDYKDFIDNFTSRKLFNGNQIIDTMLSSEWLFFDILEDMNSKEREYWIKLYKIGINKLIETNLFRTNYRLYLEYLKRYSSVYDEESYYRLQSMLRKKEVKINYHICDIVDIHKNFAGNKYDLIMFDNILQYYKSIPQLENAYSINRFVKEKWASLLNENGQIQLGYGFEVACDAVKKTLKDDDSSEISSLNDIIKEFCIAGEIKEGFFPNMIKKYYDKENGPYFLDFIAAVEEDDGQLESENVILSYKKAKIITSVGKNILER